MIFLSAVTEYYLIRVLLAVALLCLCFQVLPGSLRVYAAFLGIFRLIPPSLDSSDWQIYFWWPASVVQIVMAWIVCVKLFDIQTRGRTFWHERMMVMGTGICLGLSFTAAGMYWHPGNAFQGWTIIDQYLWLAMFVGSLGVAIRLGCFRPLLPTPNDPLIRFWLAWLATQAFRSTTAKAGLYWRFFPPPAVHPGVIFRKVNMIGMAIQILAVLYLCLKGTYARRRKHSASTAPGTSAATA